MLGWLLVVLVFCFGLVLGAVWTSQAIRPTLRRQAEERRRLNEEWTTLHAARHRQGQWPSDDDLHGGVTAVDPSDSPALSSTRTAGDPIRASTSGPGSGSFQRNQKSGKSPSSDVHGQRLNSGNLVQTTLPITIYLSDESVHEQVEAAVEDLLVAAGGHIEDRDDPVLGSWFRRMGAAFSKFVDSPLGHEVKNVAAHAAESRLVHAQDATITATMLQNLGPVLAALQPTKEAVIRAGALLIVKTESTLVVHQLTSTQQLQLDHQPQLAQSPRDILSALELQLSSSGHSADRVVHTQALDAEDPTVKHTTAPGRVTDLHLNRDLLGGPAFLSPPPGNRSDNSFPHHELEERKHEDDDRKRDRDIQSGGDIAPSF